jgi:RHS repeat-associated protein
MVTNENDQLVDAVHYFPFGEVWLEERPSSLPEEYFFTAKELDPETGFYDFGARYLDPRFSKWMSADPALGQYLPGGSNAAASLSSIGGVFQPKNLALYGYGHYNPPTLIDPNGGQVAVPMPGGVPVPILPETIPGTPQHKNWAEPASQWVWRAFNNIWEMAHGPTESPHKKIIREVRAGWEDYKRRLHNGPPEPLDPRSGGLVIMAAIVKYYNIPNSPSPTQAPGLPEYKDRGPTTGVLRINGVDYTLTSGYEGPSSMLPDTGNPGMNFNIRSHVESHAAAIMRETGAKEATLYLNRDPCSGSYGGCHEMLERMLPPNATLWVESPGNPFPGQPYVGTGPR